MSGTAILPSGTSTVATSEIGRSSPGDEDDDKYLQKPGMYAKATKWQDAKDKPRPLTFNDSTTEDNFVSMTVIYCLIAYLVIFSISIDLSTTVYTENSQAKKKDGEVPPLQDNSKKFLEHITMSNICAGIIFSLFGLIFSLISFRMVNWGIKVLPLRGDIEIGDSVSQSMRMVLRSHDARRDFAYHFASLAYPKDYTGDNKFTEDRRLKIASGLENDMKGMGEGTYGFGKETSSTLRKTAARLQNTL